MRAGLQGVLVTVNLGKKEQAEEGAVVSSAVFLSVGSSLIAVGFGSSFQLLSRGFSFRHNGGGRRPLEEGERGRGRGRKREKGGEEVGKHALLIKLQAWRNGLPRPQVSVCRIETKRLRRREPKNSVKKESPFWDPSIEGERAREP
jgi:hypothetical protein